MANPGVTKAGQVVAFTELDFARVIALNPTGIADTAQLARRSFDISTQFNSEPHVAPGAYQNAIETYIRTAAQVAPVMILLSNPRPVMVRALSNAISCAINANNGNDFQMVTSFEEARTRGSHGLLVNFINGYQGLPNDPKRHIAGNPLKHITMKSDDHFLQLLTAVSESRILARLGSGSCEGGDTEPHLKLVNCSSSAQEGGDFLTLQPEYLRRITLSQNATRIDTSISPETPQAGFLKTYHESDFKSMLDTPGCCFNILAVQNQVLGYLVGFLDPSNIPQQGRRLIVALDAAERLPDGKVGYAQLLQVTPQGREFGQVLSFSFIETLHEDLVYRAKSAGLTHLVCEVRGYPYPNLLPQRLYQSMGWKDSHVSVCYPITYDLGQPQGPSHFYGKIFIKDLRS
jgi:hypothetical protein